MRLLLLKGAAMDANGEAIAEAISLLREAGYLVIADADKEKEERRKE